MFCTPPSGSADPSAGQRPSGALLRIAMRRPDRRITVAMLLICCAIYLPVMGSYGMFDPWETIYTEVARQFMERDDWLSPYWHNGTGPEGWAETSFWSKPIGSFWLSGLSLKLFGLENEITLRGTGRTLTRHGTAPPTTPPNAGPDPGETLANGHVEWAVRLPFFLCGLFGIFCVYLMCTRLFNRRTGVFAAVILATSPMYFMITRQAMTDMPYAGLITGGLALFVLAMFGESEPLPRKRISIKGRQVSWPHAFSYYSFVTIFALIMVLMLRVLVKPLLSDPIGLRIGSWSLSKAVWMLLYVVAALLFVWLSRKTRTKNEVYLYWFYLATAVGGLSKGLVGALQPGMVIFIYLLASREWRMLTGVALGRGLLIATAVFAPWWHAMVLHHGARFWNELMGTEQLRRLTVGEQKQATGTWEYYLRQLGYGMFPWIALLPAGLARAFDIGNRNERLGRDRARLFCYVWFAAAILLFSLAATKYHHYILPAIPPAAIIVALYLDDLLAGRARALCLAILSAIAVLAIVTIDLLQQPAHWVWMYTYLYTPNWARGAPDGNLFAIYAALFAIAMLVIMVWRPLRHGIVWGLLIVAVGMGGYVLNWYQLSCAPHWGQKEVLQTYYRLRNGPQDQLVAWQFNWRGETWYTAAQVVVAKSTDNTAIKKWLKERTGRRFFFITERSRYAMLRNMLPTAKGRETLRIVDDSNVHFVLAEAHL